MRESGENSVVGWGRGKKNCHFLNRNVRLDISLVKTPTPLLPAEKQDLQRVPCKSGLIVGWDGDGEPEKTSNQPFSTTNCNYMTSLFHTKEILPNQTSFTVNSPPY